MNAEARTHREVLGRLGGLLGAHAVREILQAAFVISLARYSTETYGQFMLAFAVGQILMFVANSGLNQALVCEHARRPEEQGALVLQLNLLKVLILCAATVGIAWFMAWQDYAAPLRAITMILCAGVAIEILGGTFFTLLQIQGRQQTEGRIRSVSAVLGFGWGLAALWTGCSTALVAAFRAIEALAGLWSALRATAHHRLAPLKALVSPDLYRLLRVGLPFALAAMASLLYNKINLFFLQRAGGTGAVAQYSAAWSFADGLIALASNILLNRILFPLFARSRYEDACDASRLARSAFAWLLLPGLAAALLLWAEGDRLIALIYGPAFHEAIVWQKLLTVAIPIGFLHNLAAYLLLGTGSQKRVLQIYVAGLLLNVILCVAWIPRQPLAGAVGALLATKVAVAAFSLTLAQRRFAIIPWRNVAECAGGFAVAVGLWHILRPLVPAEAAVTAACVPLLVLAAAWHRRHSRHGAL